MCYAWWVSPTYIWTFTRMYLEPELLNWQSNQRFWFQVHYSKRLVNYNSHESTCDASRKSPFRFRLMQNSNQQACELSFGGFFKQCKLRINYILHLIVSILSFIDQLTLCLSILRHTCPIADWYNITIERARVPDCQHFFCYHFCQYHVNFLNLSNVIQLKARIRVSPFEVVFSFLLQVWFCL